MLKYYYISEREIRVQAVFFSNLSLREVDLLSSYLFYLVIIE